jgi:hypothetical protein
VLVRQPEICNQIGLSVLITSAEEFGTLGAAAFVRQHGEQLRRQERNGRLYILNFDGPGVDGKLYWVGKDDLRAQSPEPSLFFLARQACKELDYDLGKFSLPGALFDHVPFADHGFDAGSLIAIGRASTAVHTPRDATDLLHVRGFEQAGRVAMQIIGKLLALPKADQPCLDSGIDKSDIYKADPILRFMRDRMHLTPTSTLLIALGLGIADLVIAHGYDLWYSRDGIIGALQDPPYLLTIFVIIPLFLRTYVWLPDGWWCIFQGLPMNHLVRDSDRTTYQKNVRAIIGRFNHSWFLITVMIAVFLQIMIVLGNAIYPDTYNTFLSARLIFFRIPYGLLALYCASAVVVHSVLCGDWSQLTKDIEPQIHPMHPDNSAGYGSFTHCIINLLGIFVGIATFFFTKALFQPSQNQVTFQPVYNFWIILSTVLYLIVGFILFLYIPTGAARRAIRQAKRKQIGILAERYNTEQQILLGMVQQGQLSAGEARSAQPIKIQIERLKLLNEAMTLVDNVPSSPINRRTIQRFGLSYISIYLSTLIYNFLRAYMSEVTAIQFKVLLEQGSLIEILRGILRIFLTGQL